MSDDKKRNNNYAINVAICLPLFVVFLATDALRDYAPILLILFGATVLRSSFKNSENNATLNWTLAGCGILGGIITAYVLKC